ncbi:MutL DNA mismatch repair protein [Dictyostelium discoideum AX4]|uniref:Mismatch repair endonuclease pms1 n=1 Tax=Dictyostelium discoideum TaxID=44689 RepID=PMS1_DICDI|nr:MutL DNA mismatch repair protein [Dictyostelium discoideum AX4]Q54QA0.1 RecName: Full=Mismatch repair endonuclease pms1 [Dictyostelium discoideum]EAL65478.1 MutL DNA mismatch repair protein [Dictyostelium discoideum AX4]|eukprot:XP_638844.1 MutL DNA mismatch repair protein [Dictyostelium discoideum AX4]
MIKAIDKESINNICSGQVIFDLSIAVKELIENSIDAGATTVEIRLKEYGEEFIEVIDNGSGVEPSNFVALTMKHCTSKLESFSDLLSIETYGFRGEALSSLCSLSNCIITTRTKNQVTAQRLVFDKEGKIQTQTPVAREVGTTVQLSNLFKGLPVRYQEFKRNIKKEYAKLLTILQAYALISTNTRITCYNQAGKSPRSCVLSTTSGSTIRDNLINVFGTKMSQSLDEFTASDSLFKVNGLISKIGIGSGTGQSISNSSSSSSQSSSQLSSSSSSSSSSQSSQLSIGSLSRSCADRQFFFVNSRPFEHSKLAKEINSLYQSFHKRGSYPVVIFNIEMPTNNYDVNVTPDKRTIFIQKEQQLLLLITDGLKTMWETAQSVFDTNQLGQFTFNDENENDNSNNNKQSKISSFPNLYTLKTEEDENNNKITTPIKKHSTTTTTSSLNSPSSNKKSSNSTSSSSSSNNKNNRNNLEEDGDDSFDITDQQPLKRAKYDGNYNNSNKKPELPKTPYPNKKKNNENEDEDEDEDNYVQPVFSNVNKSKNSSNSGSSNSLDDIIDDNEFISRSNGNSSNFMDDFEFKGSSNNIGSSSNGIKLKTISNNNNSNNSNNSNKIIDDINKTIDKMKQQQQPQQKMGLNDDGDDEEQQKQKQQQQQQKRKQQQQQQQIEEEEEETIDGYKQKNSKTFDITIKTDLNTISKQYLIRNGTFDKDNNPIIPNTALVVSNDDMVVNNNNSNEFDQNSIITTTSEKCCIVDKSIPQLDGKFSTSLGGIGAKQQQKAATQVTSQLQQQPSQTNQKTAEEELTKFFKKEYFKQMIVIGQFNLGFIIAKLGNDLFIIDQHAADEKYNFEILSKSVESSINSQPLLKPDTLSDLTSEEELIIIENVDLFKKNGFKFIIDHDAPTRFKIKLSAFPIIHGQSFGIKDIYEWIFMIKESSIPGSVNKIPRLNSLLASKACRKSIMVGTTLTHKEMKDVLNNLSTLDNPWCCPHGRPTMRHLVDLSIKDKLKQQQQQQQQKQQQQQQQ